MHFGFVASAAFGHVNPTLPLVEELVSRGHQVSYATGPEQLPAVVRAGAIPLEMDWQVELGSFAGTVFTTDGVVGMINTSVLETIAHFPPLLDSLDKAGVEALCIDTIEPAGRCVAHKLGLPEALTVPHVATNEHFTLEEFMFPRDFDPTDPKTGEIGRITEAFLTEHDLPAKLLLPGAKTAPLHLVFVPRWFQPRGDTFDDTFAFLGPALPRQAGTQAWQPPADGSPVLLVSAGTVYNNQPELLAKCVKAFADSPWHVVMATGRTPDLGRVPANFELHRQVPQLAVLRHAKAFISHSGMNSTMEAFYHGVPLVSVPQIPEQRINGRRTAELGLGRVLETGAITAELLRTTVDELAGDPEVAANLRRRQQDLRTGDPAQKGADVLEEHLRRIM